MNPPIYHFCLKKIIIVNCAVRRAHFQKNGNVSVEPDARKSYEFLHGT